MTVTRDDILMGELAQASVNAIRVLAMDAVQAANSGHPGLPLGMADVAYVLWGHVLKHNPADPTWFNRDRFILSAGHGSMLVYALLHLSGYDLPLDELRRFRQLHSTTPGHPEYGHTIGVETTTGPLGQGLGNAVGMALAEKHLAARFNQPDITLIDHYTYVIASDGDMMEGISHEAGALAGHLQLGKLIAFYDSNDVSLDGPTSLSMSDRTAMRFESYGWHVQQVDGHDRPAVAAAIAAAQAETVRPSLIVCETTIAYGSPNKAGTAAAHGAPLGDDEVRLTKEALGYPTEPAFYVSDAVYAAFDAKERGAAAQHAWERTLTAYRERYPQQAAELDRMLNGSNRTDVSSYLPVFAPNEKGMATRSASEKVINALAPHLPELLGGAADLHSSTKTLMGNSGVLSAAEPGNRNLYYGVREHAMGAALNGLALHGGVLPYGATFLVFSDYLRPTIRLAALMGIPVIYVFTHDSIAVGEDGPTHEPVEQLTALRIIPNLCVIRPADATETAQAWRMAVERRDGPTALVLSRQNLPVLAPRTGHAQYGDLGAAEGTLRGGYVLRAADNPQVVLIATGSEVALALGAAVELAGQGVAAQVVSMPCRELFLQQEQAYREQVVPPAVAARVILEAGVAAGWEGFVTPHTRGLFVTQYGASAPMQDVLTVYGFTVANVVQMLREVLG